MFGSLTDFDRLFEEFRRMEQQIDQLFGYGAQPSAIRSVPRGTFPPVNLGATTDAVEVYLFAPGLDPGKLDLKLEQNLLTIGGERNSQAKEGAIYYRQERFSGPFQRVIELPDDVDPDRVQARYRDGILHITAQRRESAKPHQITVQ
jgi:HSP20 family protein